MTDEMTDFKLRALAEDIADCVGPLSFEYEASRGEPWGDAQEGDLYHSEYLYGSNQGPEAARILWDDLREDAEDEQPEWADELCDDLAEQVSNRLRYRFPEHDCVCAYWEDNCLWAIVSEK